MFYYFHPRLLQEIQRRPVRIALLVDHLGDAGVDHHLGAEDAGLVGAVEGGALNADAVQRRLDDGVLLCMHRPAQLMAGARGHVLASAAHAVAVLQACRSAVVAGGEDALVFHKERAQACVEIDPKRILDTLPQ